ncbi:hypothetical protein [Niastella vici]|nr:hypothetical protein [Niastella vici]
MMKQYILYLVFDSTKIQNEFVYSLLSLDKVISQGLRDEIEIIVYTNIEFQVPPIVAHFKITFRVLDKSEYETWLKRSNNFFLTLKAWILKDFFSHYRTNALFVDTDTFFVKDPLPLFQSIEQGHLQMHVREEKFLQKTEICNYLKTHRFNSLDGTSYAISTQAYMWNSGVVGVNYSNWPIVDEIINLIEQISNDNEWPKKPTWDSKLIEQLAFSYFFQRNNKIRAAEQYIIHYWFFKPFRLFIGKNIGYFNGSDEIEFSNFIKKDQVQRTDVTQLEFKDVSSVLFTIMNEYSYIYLELLFNLPAKTFIGELLREEIFG